jgi:hypothetical protein
MAGCGAGPTTPSQAAQPAGETPVATQTAHYSGVVLEPVSGEAGVLQITTEVPATLSSSTDARTTARIPLTRATLTLKDGRVIPLTGHYDTTTDMLYLSGGGYVITFKYKSTKINPDGTFTTPQGIVGGAQITLVPAPPPPSEMFCGDYRGSESGSLFLTVQNGRIVTGYAYQRGEPDRIVLSGTAVPSPIGTMQFSWSYPGGRGTATGTANVYAWSGIWDNTDDQRGIWSVATIHC